jgi:hypothetical protein
MAQGVMELSSDAEPLLARSSERLLLSDPYRFGRSLPPYTNGLGRAQQYQEPSGQGGHANERGSRLISQPVIQPGENADADHPGDRGGEPVPSNNRGEVRHDQWEPDGAIRVSDHLIDQDHAEHHRQDGHRMAASQR